LATLTNILLAVKLFYENIFLKWWGIWGLSEFLITFLKIIFLNHEERIALLTNFIWRLYYD